MTEMIRLWAEVAARSWRLRRTDDGGLTDDVAMMAILVAVAVVVGGALLGLLTGAIEGISFDVPGT
jgi:hypothetical protein